MDTDNGSVTKTEASAFDRAYEGTPPWDIGRPQGEVVRLARQGVLKGRVLDVGCGTGENALYLAERGREVWGVDSAARAIEKARVKAESRDLAARFLVRDALELEDLRVQFDAAIDSGMFHSLTDAERPLYARSLSAALRPGATLYLLCWSEHEPGDWGPRRVTQAEIRETFGQGWTVCYIRESTFEVNGLGSGSRAWLAVLQREP